jgi:uncharacterized protein YjiS (DUF1127 family)
MSILRYDSPFEYMPLGPSYVDVHQEEPDAGVAVPGDQAVGFLGRVARLAAKFHVWDKAESDWYDLSLMSDHDLMDIGLGRGDAWRRAGVSAELDLWAHG